MAENMNALAPVNSVPSEGEWHTIFAMAQQLVPTGFLPEAINTPQKAAAIVLKGRELGIPPMYALSNISVIKGKPTANSELMLALVKRAYGRDAIWVEQSTPKVAKIGYLVHGKPKFYEYTIEMAKQAQLLSNQTWTKYPDAMLRARAISAVCRMEFPEVIGGMYVPGELGERVEVDSQTGEIVSVVETEFVVTDTHKGSPTDGMYVTNVRDADDDDIERYTLPASTEADRESANKYFHTILTKYGVTEEQKREFIRFGGIESGSARDMSTEQLRKAAKFLDSHADVQGYMEHVKEVNAKKANDAELKQIGAELSAQLDSEGAA